MSAIIGGIALAVLVMAAAAAKWNSSLEKPAGDDDLDGLHCVEGDTPLAAAVDAHWDLTGERPVWRGAGFERPTKKGDEK